MAELNLEEELRQFRSKQPPGLDLDEELKKFRNQPQSTTPATQTTVDDWRDAGATKANSESTPVMVDDFGRTIATMSSNPPQPATKETEGNSALGWFKDAVDSGAASALAGQAHFMDANFGIGGDTAKYFDEVAERNKREKQYNAKDMIPFASDYWTNPQGAVYDVGNMVGSAGALGAEAVGAAGAAYVAGGGTAATGATLVAARIASQFPTLAKLVNSPLGKLAVLNVAKTPFEAISEGGNIVTEMRNNGYSEEEIKSATRELAAANAAFLTASNTTESLGMGWLGKGVKNAGQQGLREGAKAIAKRGAIGAAGGSLQNAFEERTQTALSNDVMGNPTGDWYNPLSWTQEEINSAAAGGVGGAVLGGAGGAFGGATSNRQASNQSQDPYQAMAQSVSAKTGIPAEFVYGQLYHESGGFNSRLARENNNFAGLTQEEANGEDNKQPDGNNYYRQFENPEQFADSFANYLLKYKEDGILDAKTPEDYAAALKRGGYYGDTVENYAAGIRGGMSKYVGGDGRSSPDQSITPMPEPMKVDYTPEETQQAVTWLEDQIPELQTSNIEEANRLEDELAKKNINKLLETYMVPDGGGNQVPLGQRLFPEKFQQQSQVNQQEQHSPEQPTRLENRAQVPDIKQARLAIDGARSALQEAKQNPMQNFVPGAVKQHGKSLVNVLNAANTQKFDQAAAAKMPLPARTEPVKSQTPVSSLETMQRLTQLTGQQPVTLNVSSAAPNQAGIDAVNQLRQQVMPAQEKLPTAEVANLKRRLFRAVNSKDYPLAINLAKQLGLDKNAQMYENALAAQQGGNARERITMDDIRRNDSYSRLDDMEKLFIDAIDYHKAPIHAVEAELEKDYNGAVDEYVKVLRSQMRQGAVKTVSQNASGDLFTRNQSMNYQWYRDMLQRNGVTTVGKMKKADLDYELRQIAEDHLRNGYTDPSYGPQVSEVEKDHFNDLEATINGIGQVREKVKPALREELRQPESGRAGRGESIRNAAKDAIPIGRELGREAKESGSARVKQSAGRQTPSDAVIQKVMGVRFIPKEKWNSEENAIAELGRQMGAPVRFFIAEREKRGFHTDGITYINRNGNRGIEWTFWHETLHWTKQQSPALYRDLVANLEQAQAISPEQISAYRDTIELGSSKDENGQYIMTDQDIIEEMFGDEMADVARRQQWFKQLQKDSPSLFDRIVEFLKEALAKLKASVQSKDQAVEQSQNPGEFSMLTANQVKRLENELRRVLLNIKDATGQRLYADRVQFPYQELAADAAPQFSSGGQESFAKQLDDWAAGKLPPHKMLVVGQTPESLIHAGAKQLPIEISPKIVTKIVNAGDEGGKHGLGLDILKRLPENLSDSVMIFKSATKQDAIVVLTEMISPNGKSVVTAIHMERQHGSHKVNAIASVYGKDNALDFVSRQIQEGRLLYEDKEKSRDWLRSRGLQLPKEVAQQHDSITSILPQSQKDVNGGQPDSSNKKKSHEWFYSRGLQLPKDELHNHDSIDSIVPQSKKDVNDDEQPHIKLSSDPIGDNALEKLKKQLGADPKVTVKPHSTGTSVGVVSRWLNSVSVLAKDHPKIKAFVHIAAKAREKQEDLRQHFKHRADKWTKALNADGNYEENKAAWSDLLWKGDALEKEFTTVELQEMGYAPRVIQAYKMVREAMHHAYKLANDVRQEVRTYSKNMSVAEVEKLRENKFVTILSEKKDGNQVLVSYKAPKIREQIATLTKAEFEALKQDENIQIVSEKPLTMTGHVLPGAQGLARGDDFFEVEYREQKPPVGNKTGYLPHFFHEWFIMEKAVDPDTGKEFQRMLGSGKTMREAVKKANQLSKAMPLSEIIVQPKQFQFPGAAEQAALVGDKDYFKMVQKVADDLSIGLGDANAFLSDKVHMKNRHRFVGNFMKRTGAKGFEKDLDWVLGHYFNMIGRYVALDPFKHEAISRFERVYGSYDGRRDGEAAYVRNYIDDVLGVPTQIEKDVNSWLERHPQLRAWLGNYLGDRPSLQLAGTLTSLASATKLNFLNVASTMLQATQFMNVAASLNSYEYASKGLAAALEPSIKDNMILHRAGLQSNLSLDNAAGYSNTGMNKWVQWSTISFRYMDGLVRKAAILGAYEQAVAQGKSRGEAIQYAKEINHKANFEYAVDNAPDIFRRGGPVSQVLLQFKKYPIMQIEYMADLAKNGAFEQNMKFWVPYLLMSGIWGIPFVGMVGGFFGLLFGVDWEEKLKKASFEWAGDDAVKQTLVKSAWYSAIPGMDVAKRAGIGEFGTPEFPKDGYDALGKMFGVAGSSVFNIIRQAAQGNTIEAVKAFSPGVGNVLQAAAGETKGKRGRTQTRYDDLQERIIKAVGFMPIEESVERDRNWIINTEKQKIRDDVAEAIDDYLAAEAAGNQKEKAKAGRELQRLRVTGKQLADERRRKQQTNSERTEKKIPKKYRSEFKALEQFQ